MTADEEHAGLYVMIEAEPDPAALARLEAALGATACEALLIRPLPRVPLDAASVMPLVQCAQRRGVAALLADDAAGIATLGGDGVHLSWRHIPVGAYQEARASLGAGYIVGADAGRSRDDAMRLGEAGADYISFGIPPEASDLEAARRERLELIRWWAEIFAVPCVAFDAGTPDEAAELSRAGADFVAVRLPGAGPAAVAADWVREVAAAIRPPRAAA